MEKLRLLFVGHASRGARLFVPAILLGLLASGVCSAASITLAWNPNTDSVAGYSVFYGEKSVLANPSTQLDVGNVQQFTIAGLAPGTTYYFALKAYNAYGQSGFSNEVAFAAPADTSTSSALASTTSSLLATSSVTASASTVLLTTTVSSVPTSSVSISSIATTTSSVLTTTSSRSTTTSSVTSTASTLSTTTSSALTTTSATSTTTSSVTSTTSTLSATTSSALTTTSATSTTASAAPTTTAAISITTTTVATSTLPAAATTSAAAVASVTLAWDRNADPAAGYIIYYGQQSVLTNPATAKDVGNMVQYTIPGLATGQKYYFALKAYNSSGQSGFSNEVSYSVPAGSTTTAATSAGSTTSTAAVSVTSTSVSLPTTTASTSTAVTTTTSALRLTTTSSLRPTTTTTAAEATSTTTTAKKGRKHLMGGKGASPLSSQAAAEKTAPESDAENQGAVTIFDDSVATYQLSVGWSAYTQLNGEARIATGDIDGDGRDEVVLGLGPVAGNPEIPGGYFQILNDDFSEMGWGRIEWDEYNSANGESWPACGDIDGDGKDEILIGLGIGGNGMTEVFKFADNKAVHSSWIKVGWEEYSAAGGGVRPACGNIDAYRKSEIVLGLYPVSDAFLPDGRFEVLDGKARHLAWGAVDWPDYNLQNGETRPACGDINRTMRDEILVGLGTGSGGRIPVYSYALGRLSLKTWLEAGTPEYRQQNGETRIACGDIDDDGFDEILVGFGKDGQGAMELHDDAAHNFQLLSRLQTPDDYYNMVNGEMYPAIKATKSAFPRIMNFFLKALEKKETNGN